MNRFIQRAGDGSEVLVAAVTSIVLTVLAIVGAVLSVHSDQTEWPSTTVAEPHAVDPADVNGGGLVWG